MITTDNKELIAQMKLYAAKSRELIASYRANKTVKAKDSYLEIKTVYDHTKGTNIDLTVKQEKHCRREMTREKLHEIRSKLSVICGAVEGFRADLGSMDIYIDMSKRNAEACLEILE